VIQGKMTVDRAIAIAQDIAKSYAKYGDRATIKELGPDDLRRALSVLGTYVTEADLVTKEELTKVKRQYAALNARYQKLVNKDGSEGTS